MYAQRKANLFDAFDMDAIAHGCNCQGLMGAGIAFDMVCRYGAKMLDTYRLKCRYGAFTLGEFMVWDENKDLPILYNLATQILPGRHADPQAISSSVTGMLRDAEKRGIKTIGVPKIGCGIGGLNWEAVDDTFRARALSSPVLLTAFVLQ